LILEKENSQLTTMRCPICREVHTKLDYLIPANSQRAKMLIRSLTEDGVQPQNQTALQQQKFDPVEVFGLLKVAQGRVLAIQKKIMDLFKEEIKDINGKLVWKAGGLGLQTIGFIVSFSCPIAGLLVNTGGAAIDLISTSKYSKADQARLIQVRELFAERDRDFEVLKIEMALTSAAEYVLNTELDSQKRSWWTKLVKSVARLFDKVIPIQKVSTGVSTGLGYLKAYVLDNYQWKWVENIPTFSGLMKSVKEVKYLGTVIQFFDTALTKIAEKGAYIEGVCLVLQWITFLFEWKAGSDRKEQLRELLKKMGDQSTKLTNIFDEEARKLLQNK